MTHSGRVRDQVFGLLGEGLSLNAAARRVGVHPDTARDWAKLAGVELRTGRRGGAVGARLPGEIGDRAESGGRLGLRERTVIEVRHGDGWSVRRIARVLGVAPSTVSRELARGRSTSRRYRARTAEVLSRQRRARPRPAKLDVDRALRSVVVAGLRAHHSPEQIAHRLRILLPGRHDGWVSHETIYQALYVQGKGSLRDEIAREKVLRSGRTHRIPRSKLGPRPNRSWIGDCRITARPAEANDRVVPGHWEGDLVVGRGGRSAIITLAERSTRYVLLGQIATKQSSDVVDQLQTMIAALPATLRRSLAWDQGNEMAQHARFTIATGCPVYFCDPHSPWQRGTNENTNGLVREFFPKGTDFTTVTAAELARVEHLLNNRPRQTLDWRTPTETLTEFIRVATTT